ncbi:MAG: flagellar hook-associated protein FlgK [Planctomycetota bacterium]
MGLSTNIGLRALLTSQAALDTIGHNVANANTEGFSRQRLLTSSARPLNLRGLQLGHGVQGDAVVRSVDDLLNARVVRQTSSLHRLGAQLTEMRSVEALFDEPGENGLGGLLDGLFSSLSSLSASPEDAVARNGVVQSTDDLVRRFHQITGEVDQLQRDSQVKARAIVEDVDVLAARIVELNGEIVRVEAEGATVANDLRDRRELAVRDLAKHIDIEVRENAQGAILVQVDGRLLVGSQSHRSLEVETGADGEIVLRMEGDEHPIEAGGGELAGLIAFSERFVRDVASGLDSYARSIVLELNRAHSTGVPLDGGFQRLVAENALQDLDGDGEVGDVLLRDVGLPFEVRSGELFVHTIDDATGDLRTRRIEIDPLRTTVAAFARELNDIDGLSARIDGSGRLSIDADAGVRFHFGRPLDGTPDDAGTFGGARASTTGSALEPFSMGSIVQLDMVGPVSAFSVTIDPAPFDAAGSPTAEEIAGVLNANADMNANGLRAVAVGGRLAIQTVAEGAAESFQIVGGSALAPLGLAAGTFTGQDLGVEVAMTGTYGGDTNEQWTFEPLGDGTIGTTPGLEVAVKNAAGAVIATLDVGEGYAPGTDILVLDGVSVSFTVGDVSASDGDAFSATMVADGDTSDVLVAFGLNSFMVGDDAASIDVRAELRDDPRLLAASATGDVGDGGALLDMISARDADVADAGATLGELYGTLVGGVGFEIGSTVNAQEIESFVLGSLEAQREEVSGVNVDEELVRMIEYEQTYSAAARFLQVVGQLNDTVLALI